MPNRMLVTVAVDAPIATFVGQLIGVVLPENHPDLIGGARGRRGNSDGRGLQPEAGGLASTHAPFLSLLGT